MFDLQSWLPGLEAEWVWVVHVFIVVLLTAFASYFSKKILARALRRLKKTSTNWDEILITAMSRPLTWLVWLLGLKIALDLIFVETGNPLFSYAQIIRDVGVLVCLTWFVLGFVRGAENEFSVTTDKVDRTTAQAISKLIRLAVLITAALVMLQTLGFSVSGVLAMGGVGGIAVGFAAKDLLANFFGGLVVYLDRPFVIGDWIRSPDREIEGTVEKIGWRVSVIRNFESRPIYVPNSIFTTIVVENPSRMNNRRIHETIGLRYADIDTMDKVVAEVSAMLRAHEEIETKQTLMVNFKQFSDSSVDFFVYCFTKTTQWVKFHEVKQEILLKISEIIEANNAEIAFPTSTLHVATPLTLKNQ